MKQIKLFTDGGARGNPGKAGYGFVVYDVTSGSEIILEKCGNYMGVATNNQAEYEGLISGLTWIINADLGELHLKIFMDSLLIVNQVKGEYKVKNAALLTQYQKVSNLLTKIPSYEIAHIPRSKNHVADSLYNQAIDEQLNSQ